MGRNGFFAVLCCLGVALAVLVGPVWSADGVQQQVRQVEAALARISQEQQALYQQFQMVQDLRRNDERQMLPLPIYAPTTPPNYEDVRREEEARAQRIRQHQYELDRLYTRYRELEDQKRPLLETLATLAQQRAEQQQAADRATPEERQRPAAR